LVGLYFGEYSPLACEPILIYGAVIKILDMEEAGVTLTPENAENDPYIGFIGSAILLPGYNLYEGDTFVVNKMGILSFCETIEALDLHRQPGFYVLSERMKELV
jgi:hypothetical protein